MIFQPISNWICEYIIVGATPWAAAGALHIRLPLKLLHMGTCLWWLLWEGSTTAAPNTSGICPSSLPSSPWWRYEQTAACFTLCRWRKPYPSAAAAADPSFQGAFRKWLCSVVAASESQLSCCLSCCSWRLSCGIHDWVKHPKKKGENRLNISSFSSVLSSVLPHSPGACH